MLNQQLLNPKSITVVGASGDVGKIGGKMLKNLQNGSFKGNLYVVNPKESLVQGIRSFDLPDLPPSELVILAIPAKSCPPVVKYLIHHNISRAFIVVSAGFSETGPEGKKLEDELVQLVNSVGGCLIGPNCIGVLNQHYSALFTTPLPFPDPRGCDLISGSGATAVFIMEAGIKNGLKFSSVFSTGNGAQINAEDILEFMDINFNIETDPPVKLLYLESIRNPAKLLRHASSLSKKGARLAAIKSGSTDAGRRAAASHTGAMVTSDITTRALFRKAGIVYCSSREELITVASIFNCKKLKGKNIAVITHAGGSAVMLTDTLTRYGLKVPPISGPDAEKLKSFLHLGSSVGNPIDFLATGTAEQLSIIIDYIENKFDFIDGMIVVFGSPGLMDVKNVYNVLSVKLEMCSKPIFPVLPSVINAEKEIKDFLSRGNVNFPDEVVLGRALAEVFKTPEADENNPPQPEINKKLIREIIDQAPDGYLSTESSFRLLIAAGIEVVGQVTATSKEELEKNLLSLKFPVVLKVMGPVHKTDVGGVIQHIRNTAEALLHFENLMQLKGAIGVLAQEMLTGVELYAGVYREAGSGHTVLCGPGGIFVEVWKDISAGLVPVTEREALDMIRRLKGYEIIKGYRGKPGVSETLFAEVIRRLSALTLTCPEISEMDINPLFGNVKGIIAADVRVKIER